MVKPPSGTDVAAPLVVGNSYAMLPVEDTEPGESVAAVWGEDPILFGHP